MWKLRKYTNALKKAPFSSIIFARTHFVISPNYAPEWPKNAPTAFIFTKFYGGHAPKPP